MLSIVIPTKNEEKCLPRLLTSIRNQDFNEKYEIIVADAGSTDRTRAIAKKFGCRIVKGGSIARGRNAGARAAKGEILLQLDADVRMPAGFLKRNYDAFFHKKPTLGICYTTPLPYNFLDAILFELANLFYLIMQGKWVVVSGFFMMVAKKDYLNFGGSDESVAWFEDLSFSNSIPKSAKVMMLPARLELSTRRIRDLGRIRFSFMVVKIAIYRFFGKNYSAGWRS